MVSTFEAPAVKLPARSSRSRKSRRLPKSAASATAWNRVWRLTSGFAFAPGTSGRPSLRRRLAGPVGSQAGGRAAIAVAIANAPPSPTPRRPNVSTRSRRRNPSTPIRGSSHCSMTPLAGPVLVVEDAQVVRVVDGALVEALLERVAGPLRARVAVHAAGGDGPLQGGAVAVERHQAEQAVVEALARILDRSPWMGVGGPQRFGHRLWIGAHGEPVQRQEERGGHDGDGGDQGGGTEGAEALLMPARGVWCRGPGMRAGRSRFRGGRKQRAQDAETVAERFQLARRAFRAGAK